MFPIWIHIMSNYCLNTGKVSRMQDRTRVRKKQLTQLNYFRNLLRGNKKIPICKHNTFNCCLSMPKGLVTNSGGGYKTGGEGVHVKFYPYEKGGADFFLAMLKGGTKSFGVVFTW